MVIVLIIGFSLMIVGFWGLLVKRNMIKIVISLGIVETGVQLIMISLGYLQGRTAPILDKAVPIQEAVQKVVDPVPQALVLTAIVIGVAVNALMLSFIIQLYQKKKTLSISEYRELKW